MSSITYETGSTSSLSILILKLTSFFSSLKTEIVTDDIITRISKLDYFIAMRFHAILVALKCGVKTCAINYDIKVEQLAKSANIPLISMDANENMEVIFEKLQNLNSKTLSDFANSKHVDWTHIDKLLF